MEKRARVRECLKRAGLRRLPPRDSDDLAPYGLDSLMSVLAVIELQKEFGVTIPAKSVSASSFGNVERLADLIPG